MVVVIDKTRELYCDVEPLTDEELFSALKYDRIELSEEAIQLARNGDRNKIHGIGYQYHHRGKLRRALTWFYKAAAKNHSTAQYDIGCAYHYGFGVTYNYQLARKWYLEAIKSGENQYAQLNIGMLYYQGQGVPKNIHTAAEWIRKSAEQGNASAQSSLAYIYRNNEEVRNEQKSKQLLQREVKDNSEIEYDVSDKDITLGQAISLRKQEKSSNTAQNLQELMRLMEKKASYMEQLRQQLTALNISQHGY